MTKINEDTLSLRVARSGTKRPKYGRLVPAAPQCLLMILAIAHNLIHDNRMFAKRAFYLYTFSKSFTMIQNNITFRASDIQKLLHYYIKTIIYIYDRRCYTEKQVKTKENMHGKYLKIKQCCGQLSM